MWCPHTSFRIKSSNLNTATIASAVKPEETKSKKADKDEEGWEEQDVTASTINRIEVVGNLKREEDKKEEEESHAPAWGAVKKSAQAPQGLNDKKFPSLAKSVQSSSINIDDGSDMKVNIKTSKNAFAALNDGDDEDEEDAGPKRPKEISAAKVQKAKGERETVALQREVGKYVDVRKEDKEEEKKDRRVLKKVIKRKVEVEGDEAKRDKNTKEDDCADEEDVHIVADLDAAKAKYEGRRKLPKKSLSFSEMKEQENRPPQNQASKKKKMSNWDEEEQKPKLMYLEE